MSPISSPRVLVVEHEDACPPALVGQWLTAEGATLDIRRPYRAEALPTDLGGHDAMIVLGGEMSAHDDESHPWLTATKALVRQAVEFDVALLGICLGHQLAAVALGGTVAVNPRGRAGGVVPVGWTADAATDPLCAGVPGGAVAVQWNNDVVTEAPAGSVLLASAPDGTPQALRFAARAWGVQFHPEVGAEVFRRWVDSALRRDAADHAAAPALAAVESHEQRLRDTWQPLAKAFAAAIG